MVSTFDKSTGKIDPDIDQFLSDSESFRELHRHHPEIEPWTRDSISTIETHCAKLYLSTHFVIKIKRPVMYSYIDLSSVIDRRRICLRELEINQQNLPGIYLNVVAIVSSWSGKMRFSFKPQYLGDDEIIHEWCLVMRRFDEKNVLDNVVKRGEFSQKLAHQTGRSIAEFHSQLPKSVVDDGDVRIREIIDELDFELHKLGSLFPQNEVSDWIRTLNGAFGKSIPQLISRSKAGFVRRCHGDLHLRNLVILEQIPVPFDALEFDERLSTTDVLYDLAFLIMDLCHRNLHQAARVVFNEYLLHTNKQNIAGASLMGLFISLRAGIKAMTTAQGYSSSADRIEALSYLDLAQEVLKPMTPVVVAIGGFSGSGKSTIAEKLPDKICPIPGAVLLQSDAERKDEFNIDDTEKLPAYHYTAEHSSQVYDRILDKLHLAVSHGYPVVVDATFLSEDRRNHVQELAEAAGVEFYGFWLMAPVEIMKSRILARRDSLSDADESVLEKQLRQHKGDISWCHIDTDCNIDYTVDRIVNKIMLRHTNSADENQPIAASMEN